MNISYGVVGSIKWVRTREQITVRDLTTSDPDDPDELDQVGMPERALVILMRGHSALRD